MTRLDEIKERCEKATKGPWRAWIDTGLAAVEQPSRGSFHTGLAPNGEPDIDDATFIAHSREDVPWLIGEVERLQDALEVAWRVIDRLKGEK